MNEIVYKALANRLNKMRVKPGDHDDVEGIDVFDKVIDIDQKPIGRTPRSNPATYIDLFTHIRELYSLTPEAKVRGYKPGRFSFNVRGGRCETCKGDGTIKIEMHFLPDVYVQCETCHGHRYNKETLEVRFKGKSIADVLEMSVEEALTFFAKIPKLRRRLQTLHDVGLDYVKLGQPATTLSGGEAQRVKLAAELCKVATGRTLYILDEPTTGLHFADIEKLLEVLQRLVDAGNTVVVIEHNLDVIKQADWVVDLGPEGGEAGGELIAAGTPEQIAETEGSFTGEFLRDGARAQRRAGRRLTVQEIAPGLRRWTAWHDHWEEDVGSVAVDTSDGLVLIDPLDPPAELPSPKHVLLTVYWHARAAGGLKARVWAPKRSQRPLLNRGVEAADVAEAKLPGGIVAVPDGAGGGGRVLAARAPRGRRRRRPARRRRQAARHRRSAPPLSRAVDGKDDARGAANVVAAAARPARRARPRVARAAGGGEWQARARSRSELMGQPLATIAERRARFRALHAADRLFVMPNPWDVGLRPAPRRRRLRGARDDECRLRLGARQARSDRHPRRAGRACRRALGCDGPAPQRRQRAVLPGRPRRRRRNGGPPRRRRERRASRSRTTTRPQTAWTKSEPPPSASPSRPRRHASCRSRCC